MQLVEVARDGLVATLTLDRPRQRNALSEAMCADIVAALEGVAASDARVVVVRGAGPVFCSGADLAAVSGPRATAFLDAFEGMLAAIEMHRLPTVAAIHGAALGGGLQLATACDFRICAADARLGIPSSRLGIVVNYDSVRRLVLLAGPARTKEILMAARTFTGSEAARAGLVTDAVPPRELAAAASSFAAGLAGLAPLAVQGVKRAIGAVSAHLGDVNRHDPDAVAALDRLVAESYGSEDLREGLRAMGEGRSADFRGR